MILRVVVVVLVVFVRGVIAVEERLQLVRHAPRVQPKLLKEDAAVRSDEGGRPRAEPVGAPHGLDQLTVADSTIHSR